MAGLINTASTLHVGHYSIVKGNPLIPNRSFVAISRQALWTHSQPTTNYSTFLMVLIYKPCSRAVELGHPTKKCVREGEP